MPFVRIGSHRARTRRKSAIRIPGWLRALAIVVLSCAGCSRQDTLRPVERIAINDATLGDVLREESAIEWLAGPRSAVALRLSSRAAQRFEHRLGDDARLVGEVGGQLLFLGDRVLLGVHPDSAAPFRLAQGVEAAVLAAPQRLLLYSVRDGEIVGTPLEELRPAWGWGGVGAVSTALAVSPEGDRLYQALDGVDDPETPARLLIRDLLSGRILRTIDLGEPIRALAVTAAGDLVAVGWDVDRPTASVSRYAWDEGEPVAAWTSYVPAPESAGNLRLAMTPDGRRIAIVGTNEEAGLSLIDGETGFTIADFSVATRDATFDDRGRLYAVTDSAVLRLE